MTPFEQVFRRALEEDERPAPTPFGDAVRAFEARVAAASMSVPVRARPAWAVELGVEVGCTADELRRAFRRRALETHPDRPTGSHEAFLRTRAAYDRALAWLEGRAARRAA